MNLQHMPLALKILCKTIEIQVKKKFTQISE